ncbi:hypothetical protein Tco_0086435 [Tanacetum coccineum]
MDDVIQPVISKTIHTTPPDTDYVAPATKLILDDLLEEFGDEFLNVTMVDERAECNHTKDLEELERLPVKDPLSHCTEIQFMLLVLVFLAVIQVMHKMRCQDANQAARKHHNPF